MLVPLVDSITDIVNALQIAGGSACLPPENLVDPTLNAGDSVRVARTGKFVLRPRFFLALTLLNRQNKSNLNSCE